MRKKEKEMLMHAMFNNVFGQCNEDIVEEKMLQKAIEESKIEAINDPNNPNTDLMNYEQLLQF